MLSNALSLPQANLKLALWNVEANSIPDSDLYVWISNSGVPDDIATRLYELIQHTKKIGNKVISIGKIILQRISHQSGT
jgi:D-arabinose 5-phosphate isomerase GutQ